MGATAGAGTRAVAGFPEDVGAAVTELPLFLLLPLERAGVVGAWEA